MSIILNALRKSDQERQTRQPETLENKILEKQEDVQKKNSVWLIVLVIINAFFLLIFFWSFTTENIIEDLDKKTVVAKKTNIKDKEKVKPSLAQVIVEPTTKEQISIAEQLKEKLTSNVKKDKEKSEPLKEKLASNVEKDKPEPEQQNLHIEELKKKPVNTAALVEEPLLKMVTENTNKKVQQVNAPPFLSELDYDFRRRLPEININVFVYSEIKEDRFIMIDMKKYLPGQQLDSGIKLKEIRLNSIVVEYKNRVFQIQRK